MLRHGAYILLLILAITPLSIFGQEGEGILSHYSECMNLGSTQVSATKELGLVSSQELDQSKKLQQAIDIVAERGGGNILIERGVYRFSRVYMRSGVHLLVEPGTLFLPIWGESNKDKVAMLLFTGERAHCKKSEMNEAQYIENCSIRCSEEGGRYRVDYSDKPSREGWGIRFIIASMVRNFLIADFEVIDNYTSYCAICCSPTRSTNMEATKGWKITRPTDGEIRNCSIYNATPGYGLVQCHGAERLYFENLYAKGGVTLRLETGANTPHIGVYDIQARNLRSEEGRSALMFGPHISRNGCVTVDGIYSKGSLFAVSIGAGFTTGKHKADKGATKGSFSNESKISNIHAIYGESAQLKRMNIYKLEPALQSVATANDDIYPVGKWMNSPSISAVYIDNDAGYTIGIEGVTQEGFKYNQSGILRADKPVKKGDKAKR